MEQPVDTLLSLLLDDCTDKIKSGFARCYTEAEETATLLASDFLQAENPHEMIFPERSPVLHTRVRMLAHIMELQRLASLLDIYATVED